MKRRPTIYVAGPMTGLPKFNYPKFRRVAAMLRRKGWKVVSPVEIAEAMGLKEPVDVALLSYVVDVELRALRGCDAIYALKGWEKSRGARKEMVVAISFGLEILMEGGGR